jgi:arylsulfatase
MTMRSLLFTTLLSLALLASLNPPALAGDEVSKPNVLLIVADDLSFGDLGTSGAITRTPNIDRLAENGLMFTRFHASPVCSVTRSMLLTGNYPVEVGLGAFDYALYPPAEGKPGYESYLTRTTATIAELLQDAGYNTYMVGKWHLG